MSYLFPALAAGLIAAALFLAVLITGLGFFFLFLPTLPLLWVGLSRAPKLALIGMLVASLVITLFATFSVGLFFLAFFGVPVFYITQWALLSRNEGGEIVWFPIGLIFSRLTLYAGALLLLVAFYYHTQTGEFEMMLAEHIRATFSNVGEEYAEAVNLLAGKLLFLVFTMSIWLWGLLLYAHAWFANRQLVKKSRNIRPDFAVIIFLPPHYLPALLAIAAFASLTGSPEMAFLGKCLLTALMLPYFFLGVALMHDHTKAWANRKLLLFFIYFLVFTQFIPALILAGIGLVYHIKRLSARPDSTRS